MKAIKLFTGLGFVMLLLAACAPVGNEAPTNSSAPSPTIHPFLNNLSEPSADGSDSTPDALLDGTPDAVEANAKDGIYDILIVPKGKDVIVSWTTDNPGSGSIAYGLTEQYELGGESDELPLRQHTFILTRLEPELTYYYQITSVDAETNAISIVNDSFVTTRQLPIIDVWYGLEQKFGHIGTPQRWVNILGTVSDEDGISSLVYLLNDGEEMPLSIGPDLRRLADPGDFNVDIDRADLLPGENKLVLTATDELGNQEVVTVTVNFENDRVWPGTYVIDWQQETNIQDVAEVVDGLWEIRDGAIHTVAPSYDRVVNIGDIAWTDYEVTVPVTIHGIHFAGNVVSGGPGVGLVMRWTGHTDIPVPDWQPKAGWQPHGIIAVYRWEDPSESHLRLEGTFGDVEDVYLDNPLQLETRYIYKLRGETLDNGLTLYSFKVWLDGLPEPEEWNVQNEVSGLPNGSLVLIAHQVDASFGNVKITQLAPPTASPFLPDLLSLEGMGAVSMPITNTIPVTVTPPITGTVPITNVTPAATPPITTTSSIGGASD